jgi:hypothetical protein
MPGEQKSATQDRQPKLGERDAKEDVRGREPERGRDIFECWIEPLASLRNIVDVKAAEQQ